MITSRTLDTIQTWPLAVLLAIGLAAFSGALTGLAMPYGPATAAQAMLVLLAGLAVGLAAGWLMGSRWALLLAPLAYILDGAAELSARRDLALEWFGLLDAPIKRIFTFDNAGHSVAFEQFEPFHRIMVEVVVPETYPGR